MYTYVHVCNFNIVNQNKATLNFSAKSATQRFHTRFMSLKVMSVCLFYLFFIKQRQPAFKPLACWVKVSADGILKYLSYFPSKVGLNVVWRQFAWNVIAYFLKKKNKKKKKTTTTKQTKTTNKTTTTTTTKKKKKKKKTKKNISSNCHLLNLPWEWYRLNFFSYFICWNKVFPLGLLNPFWLL